MEQLQSKDIQILRLYEAKTSDLAQSRIRLMGGPTTSAFADGGTTSWGLDDEDDGDDVKLIDAHVTVEDLRREKQQLLNGKGIKSLQNIVIVVS